MRELSKLNTYYNHRTRKIENESATKETSLKLEDRKRKLTSNNSNSDGDYDDERFGSNNVKKYRKTCHPVARELICPITHELPIEPVMAQDGRVYEKEAINTWIRKNVLPSKHRQVTTTTATASGAFVDDENNLVLVKSPITNEPMGTQLVDAIQTRNTIELLVESKIIEGDLAKHWTKRCLDKKLVKEAFLLAQEKKNKHAMYDLGRWYLHGAKGLPKSNSLALHWYYKAAQHGNVKAMAKAGFLMLEQLKTNDGEKKDNANDNDFEISRFHALYLLEKGAGKGSDFACHQLGRAYLYGLHGLAKDRRRAVQYLFKVADGSCSYKHLKPQYVDETMSVVVRLGRPRWHVKPQYENEFMSVLAQLLGEP